MTGETGTRLWYRTRGRKGGTRTGVFGQEECVDGNGDGRKRGAGLGKRLDSDSGSDNPVVRE